MSSQVDRCSQQKVPPHLVAGGSRVKQSAYVCGIGHCKEFSSQACHSLPVFAWCFRALKHGTLHAWVVAAERRSVLATAEDATRSSINRRVSKRMNWHVNDGVRLEGRLCKFFSSGKVGPSPPPPPPLDPFGSHARQPEYADIYQGCS